MKRYTKSAIILLAALSLVGCSKTEDFQHNPDSALEIESVSGISPFALTTKAVITGNTLPDSEAATGIGIFVTASDGGAYDGHNKGYTNVNFANSGSGWSTATPVYLSDTQGKLYGYFPYNGTANDLRAIPVISSLNGTDYLYAEPQTVSHSNKTVQLQMKHALSMLHLTIKKGANFTADAPLSKITLTSTAIDVTGTMDLVTGAVTATKKASETGTVELPTDGTITAEGIEKDILLVPADNSEGKKDITLILTIGGKLASVSLSGENGIDIRSGIQNNVTLTIEDTGIKVTGIGVGEWSEGFSQQVEVNSHKVTVKLAEDVTLHDILTEVYVDGYSVIVKAYSLSGQRLKCTMPDGEFCTSQSKTGNLVYTFTISDITDNTTATIGYAEKVSNIGVTPDGAGSVQISGGELYEGENVTLTAIPAYEYGFDAWLDKDGDALSCEDETYKNVRLPGCMSVRFKENLILGGEFSVSASKKVRFTRGNLYCSGAEFNNGKCSSVTNAQWRLEQHQYDYGGNWDGGTRISHFLWSKDCMRSLDKTYDGTSASAQDVFFTNSGSFTVSGFSTNQCRTLTTEEWQYLFSYGTTYDNDVRRGKYKLRVTVCGKDNCIVLLPDNWTGGTIEDSYDYVGWKHMEAAGAVCLPAAGHRTGDPNSPDPAYVSGVGSFAYYWSASPNDRSLAYYLYFNSGDVRPAQINRNCGSAVRLVTDIK